MCGLKSQTASIFNLVILDVVGTSQTNEKMLSVNSIDVLNKFKFYIGFTGTPLLPDTSIAAKTLKIDKEL